MPLFLISTVALSPSPAGFVAIFDYFSYVTVPLECHVSIFMFPRNTMPQSAFSRLIHTAAARFRSRVRLCGILANKVGLEHVCLVLLFHLRIIPPTVPHSSSWAGRTGQIVADIPNELNLTPIQETEETYVPRNCLPFLSPPETLRL